MTAWPFYYGKRMMQDKFGKNMLTREKKQI